MKMYFDMCSLQRPLDDHSQLRVSMEAEAVLGLLALCESSQAVLVASDALVFEAVANGDAVRRDFALRLIAKAAYFVKADDSVKARAKEFIGAGIKPLDALHLASAVIAQADFFCTCDDRFLKKAKAIGTAPMRAVSPLELIMEIDE